MERMTDFAGLHSSAAHTAGQRRRADAQSTFRPTSPAGASNGAQPSRFGAVACLFDSLDTRPLAMRERRRPWWSFW